FVQNTTGPYPLNFAANPYPTNASAPYNYVLPLGQGDDLVNPAGTGIFGASYAAAAGIYKNLGYLPKGYDGIDNGGVVGLVDDWGEGGTPPNQALGATNPPKKKHV